MPTSVHTMKHKYARKCRTCDHIGYGTTLTQNYTCNPCRVAAHTHTTICPTCETIFTQRPSTAQSGWTTYCSQVCYGKSRRTPDYDGSPRGQRLAREAVDGLTATQRKKLLHQWKKQGRTCTWCNRLADTVDHVLPLARGGTNWEGNLTPACRSCNSSRSDRTVTEWRLGKRAGYTRTRRVIREPKPVTVKAKPAKQSHPCPLCNTETTRLVYCSDQCYLEASARRARERYRARNGLEPTSNMPTRARTRPVFKNSIVGSSPPFLISLRGVRDAA